MNLQVLWMNLFLQRARFKSFDSCSFFILYPKLALFKLPSVCVPLCAAYFVAAVSGSCWQDTTSWRGSPRGWRGPRWRSWTYSTTSSWSCRRTFWWRPTGNGRSLVVLGVHGSRGRPLVGRPVLRSGRPLVWGSRTPVWDLQRLWLCQPLLRLVGCGVRTRTVGSYSFDCFLERRAWSHAHARVGGVAVTQEASATGLTCARS